MNNTTTAAASGATTTHYAQRDHEAQGAHYTNHVSAMTGEALHAKSAIAAELAHRDIEIDRLRAALAATAQPVVPDALEADIYVWPVPDKCDRIMWRGAYHHLPIKPAAQAPAVPPEGFVTAEAYDRLHAHAESLAAKILALEDESVTAAPAQAGEREAFEVWWPTVGQTIGMVAAWKAWQASAARGAAQAAPADLLPVVDRLLVDAYSAGLNDDEFDMLSAKAKVAALFSDAQAAPVVAAQYLGIDDLADLQRLEDLFDDGEGHDLPKVRMVRLAELGAIRHHGGGYYSITAFGRLALGGALSRLPLETVDECNARLGKEHQAKLDAARAQGQQP